MSSKFEEILPLFEKAIDRLSEVLNEEKNSIVRDSAIQRFEFTFELVWKTLKAYLEEKHTIEVRSPKESLRGAFQVGLIQDNPLWLETNRLRNLISHTYNEALSEEIYQALPPILALYQDLLKKLKTQP